MSLNTSSTNLVLVQQDMFYFWLRILGFGLAGLLFMSFIVFVWPRIVSFVLLARKRIVKRFQLRPLLPSHSNQVPPTLFAMTSTVLSSCVTRLGAVSLHTMMRALESVFLHHGLWNREFSASRPSLLPVYQTRQDISVPLDITAAIVRERSPLAVGRTRAVSASVLFVASRRAVAWSYGVLRWWRKGSACLRSVRLASLLKILSIHILYSGTVSNDDVQSAGDSGHWVLPDDHGFLQASPFTSLQTSPAMFDIASLALGTDVDDTASDESFMSSTTLTMPSTPGSLTSIDAEELKPWITSRVPFPQSSSSPCEVKGSPGSLADVPGERDITEGDDFGDDIITERKNLFYTPVFLEPMGSSFPSVDISTFFFQEAQPSFSTATFQNASVPTIIVTLPSDQFLTSESASIDSDYLSARGSDWYSGFDLDTRSYTRSSGNQSLDMVLGIIGCLFRSAFSYVFGSRI